MEDIIKPRVLKYNTIKHVESIRSKYPEMNVREQIALCVYYNVYDILEELVHRSNSTETTFVRDIQRFCKEKIEYYENGGT